MDRGTSTSEATILPPAIESARTSSNVFVDPVEYLRFDYDEGAMTHERSMGAAAAWTTATTAICDHGRVDRSHADGVVPNSLPNILPLSPESLLHLPCFQWAST